MIFFLQSEITELNPISVHLVHTLSVRLPWFGYAAPLWWYNSTLSEIYICFFFNVCLLLWTKEAHGKLLLRRKDYLAMNLTLIDTQTVF